MASVNVRHGGRFPQPPRECISPEKETGHLGTISTYTYASCTDVYVVCACVRRRWRTMKMYNDLNGLLRTTHDCAGELSSGVYRIRIVNTAHKHTTGVAAFSLVTRSATLHLYENFPTTVHVYAFDGRAESVAEVASRRQRLQGLATVPKLRCLPYGC